MWHGDGPQSQLDHNILCAGVGLIHSKSLGNGAIVGYMPTNDDELYSPLRQQKQTHTQRISERQTSTYKRDTDIIMTNTFDHAPKCEIFLSDGHLLFCLQKDLDTGHKIRGVIPSLCFVDNRNLQGDCDLLNAIFLFICWIFKKLMKF